MFLMKLITIKLVKGTIYKVTSLVSIVQTKLITFVSDLKLAAESKMID